MARHAADFYLNHLERVRRHGVTVSTLAEELVEAKQKDGRSEIYLRDLRNHLRPIQPLYLGVS